MSRFENDHAANWQEKDNKTVLYLRKITYHIYPVVPQIDSQESFFVDSCTSCRSVHLTILLLSMLCYLNGLSSYAHTY